MMTGEKKPLQFSDNLTYNQVVLIYVIMYIYKYITNNRTDNRIVIQMIVQVKWSLNTVRREIICNTI